MTGQGGHVETSLLEALVDFQFEVLTTHLNDGRRLPRRVELPQRPCLSLGALRRLSGAGRLSRHRHDADRRSSPPCSASTPSSRPTRRARDLVHRPRRDQGDHRPAHRDAAGRRLARHPRAGRHLVRQGAELARADGAATASRSLDMLQTVTREDDVSILTTRSPLRVDGVRDHGATAPRRGSASTATASARSSACDRPRRA